MGSGLRGVVRLIVCPPHAPNPPDLHGQPHLTLPILPISTADSYPTEAPHTPSTAGPHLAATFCLAVEIGRIGRRLSLLVNNEIQTNMTKACTLPYSSPNPPDLHCSFFLRFSFLFRSLSFFFFRPIFHLDSLPFQFDSRDCTTCVRKPSRIFLPVELSALKVV